VIAADYNIIVFGGGLLGTGTGVNGSRKAGTFVSFGSIILPGGGGGGGGG
jgi:hypothetical protein